MSDRKQYKLAKCPTCGYAWRMTVEEYEELGCFCEMPDIILPILREAARKDASPKHERSQKPPDPKLKQYEYSPAPCPFCDSWWLLPTGAPLPPDCDCQEAKARRERGRLGKPDPFHRFIEDDLDLD